MTAKQVFEATAIELSKIQAPTLKLYEFNYFFNQAIRQFVNKVYNVYDVNQQTTDDLRVLKATATLAPEIAESTGNKAIDYLRGATYFVNMPDDYLHLLNCICLFDVNKTKECWNAGDVMVVGATKLTADSWSSVVDDVYNRPTKKRPYYYVHNQNVIGQDLMDIEGFVGNTKPDSSAIPTDPSIDEFHTLSYTNYIPSEETLSTDKKSTYEAWTKTEGTSSFERTFDYYDPDDTNANATTGMVQKDVVEKEAGSRHANSSRVKVEIRCGRDKSNIFSLSAVQIDYVKAPQFIRLTQEQLDSDEDISQIMEFPDYVNQEIINELVNLVMRKTNDPSIQAHMQMTQSIARPTGQQQQPAEQA